MQVPCEERGHIRRWTINFLISAIALAGFSPFGQVRPIYDRVAALEAEGILQVVKAFAGRLVAAVDQPAAGA